MIIIPTTYTIQNESNSRYFMIYEVRHSILHTNFFLKKLSKKKNYIILFCIFADDSKSLMLNVIVGRVPTRHKAKIVHAVP